MFLSFAPSCIKSRDCCMCVKTLRRLETSNQPIWYQRSREFTEIRLYFWCLMWTWLGSPEMMVDVWIEKFVLVLILKCRTLLLLLILETLFFLFWFFFFHFQPFFFFFLNWIRKWTSHHMKTETYHFCISVFLALLPWTRCNLVVIYSQVMWGFRLEFEYVTSSPLARGHQSCSSNMLSAEPENISVLYQYQ